jgi:hypothetical protein
LLLKNGSNVALWFAGYLQNRIPHRTPLTDIRRAEDALFLQPVDDHIHLGHKVSFAGRIYLFEENLDAKILKAGQRFQYTLLRPKRTCVTTLG